MTFSKIESLENISWNDMGTKFWMQLQKVYGLTVQKVIYANTEAKSGDKWGQFSMLFDKFIVCNPIVAVAPIIIFMMAIFCEEFYAKVFEIKMD